MKEEDIEYTIIETLDVSDEVFDDITKGTEGEVPPFEKSDLVSLKIKVVGQDDPMTIIGFKNMLLDETRGDIAIRMVISQMIENKNEGQNN